MAPDEVATAVQEALGCRPRHMGSTVCAVHGSHIGVRGCVESVWAANAAHKASLEWATARVEREGVEDDWGMPTVHAPDLRRWADESEADRG